MSELAVKRQVLVKRFACVDCDSKFKTKRVLENHIRCKHSRIREYVCDICNKKFKTDSILFMHRKLHEQEKPYECVECKKKFRLKHHLKGHAVQHQHNSNDKPVVNCARCCKTFATKDHLRKHAKIHLLNDCNCHLCGIKLKQKRYLQQHMLKVHLVRSTR